MMRGSKNGLEIRLRKKAPQLLDIDGDSCHHIHNACKRVCKPFDYHVEGLVRDMFNDFKWSSDLREFLSEICTCLRIKFTSPECYVATRWLSVLDVTIDTLRLLDAYTIFYHAFLNRADRDLYLHLFMEIYRRKNVSQESRKSILDIKQKLQKKNMTPEGKQRKARIVQKLFISRKYTMLVLNFYASVLPLLKNYVLLFQQNVPLIHKLNDEQMKLIKQFLVCFLKPEVINRANTSKKMTELPVKDVKSMLPIQGMFVGDQAKNMLKKLNKDPVKAKFQEQMKSAYSDTADCMLKKLPINNKLLR